MIELTPKEERVRNLVTLGVPNKVIASKMNCSVRTVESHRQKVFIKYGVKTSAELAAHHEHERLHTLLEQSLQYMIELRGQWSWMNGEPRCQDEYDKLVVDIEELKGELEAS